MHDIKKKIIAIAVICAMSLSMAACSSKKSSSANNGEIKVATISSEEAEQLKGFDLEISEYVLPTGDSVQQDPVEQDDSSSVEGGNSDSSSSDGNSDSSDDESSFDPQEVIDGTDVVFLPGGEAVDSNENGENDNSGNANNNSNNNDNNNNDNSNNGNNNNVGNSSEIKGTKKIQQAIWMNLSGNYLFEGEFITATFKIKDTTEAGTYPITVDWLDFANISGVTVDAVGINGSVVVDGEATAKYFKNDGSFEVMADNVSGKPGDTVKISFKFNKNPGICASVLRFGYDSDALEYVSGGKGTAFIDAILNQNK